MSEQIHFYAFLRHGWVGGVLPAQPDISALPVRATIPVELHVNQSPDVRNDVTLVGPADVIGIDKRQVIRTDPAPYTRQFEPNFLACIDFDRPDFPWLFTPASAVGNTLQPWLALVVVEKQRGVTLVVDASGPVAQLQIGEPADPRAELPDLTNVAAWAHAQAAAFQGDLGAALTSHPETSLSRILCPRRLRPTTDYFACLVPTFEPGRQAALGLPISTTKLEPAWRLDDPDLQSITLPVFYHWEFSTGAGGDFASLARLLRPGPVKAAMGTVDLDVSSADQRLSRIAEDSVDRVLRLEGALTAPEPDRRGFTGADGEAFQAALAGLLDQPDSPDEDPVLGPPVYGDRHAGVAELPSAGTPPPWLRDLNLDPRYRVVSALGTRVVQEHQEQMLASIHRQSGEIDRANTILRHAQFLRTVGESVLRNRVGALPPGTLLQITRGVQGRLSIGGQTLRQDIDAHALAKPIAAPQFRRVARPRGPRLRTVIPARNRTVLNTFSRVATGFMNISFNRPVGGLVTLEGIESRFRELGGQRPAGQQVAFATFVTTNPIDLPRLPGFTVRTPDPFLPPDATAPPLEGSGGSDSFSAGRLRLAWAAHRAALAVPPTFLTAPAPLRLDALRDAAVAQLTPLRVMSSRLEKLIIKAPEAGPQVDPFDPLLATPELERPMYETLRDLFPGLMLPGLNEVDDNTVALLITNARFVEAFLIGLNHELGRELLWRGFPTRSRTTYFRRFWDRRGQPGISSMPNDIPPIADWKTQRLGQIAHSSEGQAVVLVRGELTRRYPNATFYLGEAVTVGGGSKLTLGTREMHPQFRGRLAHDLLFFGFGISDAAVKGDASHPGWYFVIQEAPAEPRFGVDAAQSAPNEPLPPEADSAKTAKRYLRRPVRVALHGATLLS